MSTRRANVDPRKPPVVAAGSDRQSRRLALEAARRRYGVLSAAGKRRLIDELQELTGYHRKSLLRLLNRPEPPTAAQLDGAPAESEKPHHRRRYGPEVVAALVPLWERLAIGSAASGCRRRCRCWWSRSRSMAT